MDLLVGFYQDPDPRRTAEFAECVRRNAAHPLIDRVTVFLEDRVSSCEVATRFPPLALPKVCLIEHGRRLTFAHLFDYANRHLAGAAVIVANADIFFDETLGLLGDVSLAGALLCLSRWDESLAGVLVHFDRPDSQDAWIFEAPIPHIACDFCLGLPGCDNRLAYEAERAGLALSNPSRTLRARHLHHTAIRRYTQRDRLRGSVRFIPTSALVTSPTRGLERPSEQSFPSHRGRRVEGMCEARCREVEAALVPFLGARLPRALRRELRLAVTAHVEGLPRPVGMRVASVGFRESMGYTVAQMALGVSTHNNDQRPIGSIPAALLGLRFTQVVANRAGPVELEFRSDGRLYVLAASGWEGYAAAAAFLDDAGWREPMEPLRATEGTAFEVWSLVAETGERLVVPTQVMLASNEIVKLG